MSAGATMPDSDYSAEHPGLQPIEWTSESVAEHYDKAREVALQMLPRFTQIARTAAEQTDLIVQFSLKGLPATDGTLITMPLTPAFATMDPLNPCTCDNTFRCDYCLFVALLLHEAAHIVEGSTEQWSIHHLMEFIECFDEAVEAVEFVRPGFKAWFDDTLDNEYNSISQARRLIGDFHDSARTDEHLTEHPERWSLHGCLEHPFLLSAAINPAAPMLINALEDTRINRLMGTKRTALPKPLLNYILKSIGDTLGGEGWRKAPVSMQVASAFAMKSEHNLDMTHALNSETVTLVMTDPIVEQFLEREYASNPEVSAYMTVLAEYCYYTHRVFPRNRDGSYTDPDVQEARTGGVMKSGRDSDDSGQLKPSQQKRDTESLEQARRSVERQVRRELEQANMTPEERERQAQSQVGKGESRLRPGSMGERAVPGPAQMTTEGEEGYHEVADGRPTGTITSGEGNYPVLVMRPLLDASIVGPDMRELHSGLTWAVNLDAANKRRLQLLSGLQNSHEAEMMLRRAMGVNRRTANVPNLERGRLHGSKLARAPMGNRRVFRRVDKAAKRSYSVLIGVDLSGSTGASAPGGGEVIDRIVELAYRQAELLHKAGIPFAVVGHTGWSRDDFPHLNSADKATIRAVTGGQRSTTDLYLAKGFKEKWAEATQLAVCSWDAGAKNLDGQTMKHYIRMLSKQRATDRLLLYYTDGQMPAEDGERQQVILETELKRAHAWAKRKHDRLKVIGVGYGCDDPKKYGLDTILVDSAAPVDEQVKQVVEGLAQRITDSINPHR